MSDLARQLREDRALRDAARALVDADVEHLKGEWGRKSLATRTSDRIKEGASDLYEEAVESADEYRGVLAALIVAIGLWFARHPLLSAFLGDEEGDGDQGAGDEGEERLFSDAEDRAF